MLPLKDRLKALFASVDGPRDEAQFETLALEAFAWQYERNSAYAAYCARRGTTPATVSHWTSIPVVPTAAFKETELVAGERASADAVFRTSGTTRGRGRRGVHVVPDVSLYHASLLPNFRAMVLPDGLRMAMLCLLPSPDAMPESSLAHMFGVVVHRLGARGSGFFASVQDGLDIPALDAALTACVRNEEPVCLLGTSLSFVHWLDALHAVQRTHRLPTGSRLVDTGGFKGKARTIAEEELRARYAHALGLDAAHCVNEYGMTEMCSQFYDAGLRERTLRGESGPAKKHVPPGARSRVVDPETLEPVRPGEIGLLQHFDLANLGSVLAIQTEDLGVQVGDGFRLLGRAPGATPRGCSIAMDALLSAAAERRS